MEKVFILSSVCDTPFNCRTIPNRQSLFAAQMLNFDKQTVKTKVPIFHVFISFCPLILLYLESEIFMFNYCLNMEKKVEYDDCYQRQMQTAATAPHKQMAVIRLLTSVCVLSCIFCDYQLIQCYNSNNTKGCDQRQMVMARSKQTGLICLLTSVCVMNCIFCHQQFILVLVTLLIMLCFII